MVHSVDMPSSFAENLISSVVGGGSKRSSVEKQTKSVDDLSGDSAKTDGATNGTLPNGTGATRGGIPNGTKPDDEKSESRQLDRRRISVTDMDGDPGRKPHRLATHDDGYFAEVPQREADSFLTTHVKLNAVNGDLKVDGAASPTGSLQAEPDERSQSGPLLETMESSSRPSPHRTSSPPALQVSAASSLSQPGKLQHRHTLEVPRVSTSRVSRETSRTGEDAVASGRLSPISNNNTPTKRRASASLIRRATRTGQPSDQPDDLERWVENIRQVRASKRKRKEDEDEDRVLMGTKVDQNHVNYVTAYNMLTGIRFTVSRTNAKLDRELTDADFEAKHKFSFDITGNELTPSAKYDFKFKDYAPWVFRHLRQTFQLDPADYLMSLTSKYILSELGSPGKSGSFFYFSRDYKYIIKTIHHAEHKVLRKILKEYYNHVKQNPNTLLSQFYGLHRVKIPYGRKIHFVVMNNLFPPHRDIHQTFDLKGSTIGRNFKEDDLDKNPRATLKDLNWLRRNMHLELGPTKKHMFIEQMHKDVELLQRLKIMDYSLLVGIHDLARGNEDKLRDKTLQVFQPGGDKEERAVTTNALMRTPSKLENQRKAKELRKSLMNERPVPMGQSTNRMPEEMGEDEKKHFYFYSDDGGFRATHEDDGPGEQIYYLGIIDCLTHYGLIKRLEHFWKGMSHTESQISAVPPDRYGERFVQFISGISKPKEVVEQQSNSVVVTAHSPSLAAGAFAERPTSPIRSPSDAVVERAERQAQRTQKSENAAPEKKLTTVGREVGESAGYTLPVVEETAENGSVGGRSNTGSTSDGRREAGTGTGTLVAGSTEGSVSDEEEKDGRSRKTQHIVQQMKKQDGMLLHDARPPTPPPKDDVGFHRSKAGPPTPPKDENVKNLSAESGQDGAEKRVLQDAMAC